MYSFAFYILLQNRRFETTTYGRFTVIKGSVSIDIGSPRSRCSIQNFCGQRDQDSSLHFSKRNLVAKIVKGNLESRSNHSVS